MPEIKPDRLFTQSQGRVVMLLLFVLVFIGTWQIFKPKEWEYTILAPSDETLTHEMNTMGIQGWELVSARRATSSDPAHSASYEMIFKRIR